MTSAISLSAVPPDPRRGFLPGRVRGLAPSLASQAKPACPPARWPDQGQRSLFPPLDMQAGDPQVCELSMRCHSAPGAPRGYAKP